MTKQELTEKFNALYAYMASSNNVKYMKTFGDIHKKMMAWMIENKPEAAEEYIDELCSIKWRQYLTKNEATDIAKSMIPPAPWDYNSWAKAMEDLHLECERESVFNRYAMWVAMNQIYTDFGESIAKMFGQSLTQIPADKLIPLVHDMALNLLTDPDGKYNIREYHLG